MKRLYILSIISALLMTVVPIYGQTYDPDSPAEPGMPPVALTLQVMPPNSGTVSGSGKIVPGSTVRISASPRTDYVFANWTDADGNIVSTSSSYTLTKGLNPETFTANFVYSPGAPGEPQPGVTNEYYPLTLVATPGGTVSGGGRYQAGNSVRLSAYANTDYKFVNWTDEDGVVISEASSFYYTTQAYATKLTANFEYDPNSPKEPDEPVIKRNVNVVCNTGGGTYSVSTRRDFPGTMVSLSAYPNTGYRFEGWYIGDELWNSSSSARYVIENSDVTIECRFVFDPQSPNEPVAPSMATSFYLMSEITYPGTRVDCPLFITTSEEICDMSFRLSFPAEAVPDWETLQLCEGTDGYQISVQDTDEERQYLVSMTGGTVSPGNFPLLTVMLNVPEDVECGTNYQVKINQLSLTKPDGETMTATTRNGRVYVYKHGDTNGDNEVDVFDSLNIVVYILSNGEDNEIFIKEVSDMNGDVEIDVFDSLNLVYMILGD